MEAIQLLLIHLAGLAREITTRARRTATVGSLSVEQVFITVGLVAAATAVVAVIAAKVSGFSL